MRKVYLDNAASTPLLPEVKEAMLPYLGEVFGNPQSLHDWGDKARMALDEAREKVAGLIGADAEEIIFTSGGTESNNLAVKGMALAQQSQGQACYRFRHRAFFRAALGENAGKVGL